MTKFNKIIISTLAVVTTMTMGTSLFGQNIQPVAQKAIFSKASGSAAGSTWFWHEWYYHDTLVVNGGIPAPEPANTSVAGNMFLTNYTDDLVVELKIGDKQTAGDSTAFESIMVPIKDIIDQPGEGKNFISQSGNIKAYVALKINASQGFQAHVITITNITKIDTGNNTGGDPDASNNTGDDPDVGNNKGGNEEVNGKDTAALPKAFLQTSIFVENDGMVTIPSANNDAVFKIRVVGSDMSEDINRSYIPSDAGAIKFGGYATGATRIELYNMNDQLILRQPIRNGEVRLNVDGRTYNLRIMVEQKSQMIDLNTANWTGPSNMVEMKYYIIRLSY